MIILHNILWSNWFSYGEENFVNFEESILTQVLGDNGSGKTSIIHILEEVLFNKNSKGCKKADIINRNKKFLRAELTLSVDGVQYEILLDRKTTAKVTLLKEGQDISSHTATGTYKEIQKIIGMDFNTFNQLIYQNSKQGLEFLTSADSARKKFLISLFKLDKYTDLYEIFKKAYNENNLQVRELEGKLSVLSNWLENHKYVDFSIKEIKEEIDDKPLHMLLSEIKDYEKKLNNIKELNKSIELNGFRKEALSKPDTKLSEVKRDFTLASQIAVHEAQINANKGMIKELERLSANCPTCKQDIDNDLKDTMITQALMDIGVSTKLLNSMQEKEDENLRSYNSYRHNIAAWEIYRNALASIDNALPTEPLVSNDILQIMRELKEDYENLRTQINEISKHNRQASEHNAKVETLLTEMELNRQEHIKVEKQLNNLKSIKSKLEILKTVFSTKGLVSYKIDFLIKDLQDKINDYLVVLSDGRFQLNFVLKSDSINIAIIDNGKKVDISALSTGELSRVNVSTLLAIRSLMSSLSNTKVNLLFLDEIMGVLDEVGKTNLIDILLEEKDLNTFIVSHEYTHPLLDKLYVTKTEEGSTIGSK